MADSENDSENQHKNWSQEDWRLLIITFAGSLAAILVGAATLGLAVTLARHAKLTSTSAWLSLGFLIVVGNVLFLLMLRTKQKHLREHVLMWTGAIAAAFGILVLIGIGAGIK